jgi:hypothetical protein
MPPNPGFNRNASSGNQGSQQGNNSSFMQQLQGLFNNRQQGQNNSSAQFANTGFTNYQGLPVPPSSSQLARMGGQGTTLEQRTVFQGDRGGVRPPTYGQVIDGGVAQDYQGDEAERQRELGMLGGLRSVCLSVFLVYL